MKDIIKLSPDDYLPRLVQLQSWLDGVLFKNTKVDCWVAGGAIRRFLAKDSPRTDIDVFFKSKKDHQSVLNTLDSLNFDVVFETKNSIKLSNGQLVFDLIKIFYNTPEDSLINFDFIVCMVAMSKNHFYCHHTFFVALSMKQLAIANTPNPLATLRRAFKYVKYGYYIDPEDLLYLVDQIRKLPEIKLEHITGGY